MGEPGGVGSGGRNDDQDLERAAARANARTDCGRRDADLGRFLGNLVWQLFQFLIGFAGVGRAVHDGGENMIEGESLGDSLEGLPLVGSQVKELTSGAFAAGGKLISDLVTELEQFIAIVSVVLALLLARLDELPSN
jgi:hypothetical protein